jgi:short subunit dehydrogenase-like uncharacterized protein
MKRPHQIIIYGSYGYTGTVIVEECKNRNLDVLLAGRDSDKLKKQSDQIGFPYEAADVKDPSALKILLQKGRLVIHCAGPFQHTAKQMVEACLEAGTHYTDITGEYLVFELLAGYNDKAREKNITIMPGTGFDVVPSDCLALHLKKQLPTATHLQLAFMASKGGVSRGTAKTMVEGLGVGSTIRSGGKLVDIPLGEKVIDVNFGSFQTNALCIPWGDISTAWRSTGIPNIEVYTAVSDKTIRYAKLSRWFNWVMRSKVVKNFLTKKIDSRPAGPDEQKRTQGRSYLWGKVWDKEGKTAEARMETLSGYLLTARTAVFIAEKILGQNPKSGYFTPAQYFGSDLILEIEGTIRTDLSN